MGRRILAVLLVITTFSSLCSCHRLFQNSEAAHLAAAEEYSRKKDYDNAIEEYQKHMQYRLSLKDRPEWENPFFYLILIGDLELTRGKPDAALSTYQDAEKAGVDVNLISDRYRSLSRWHEEKGDLDKAFKILKERRDRDPLLIDSMLDRLSKTIVQKEEAAAHTNKLH